MKIDKDVPVPKRPIDILKSMSVGDSVFDAGQTTESSKIYAVARQQPKRTGMKFTARTANGGLRIWRIE